MGEYTHQHIHVNNRSVAISDIIQKSIVAASDVEAATFSFIRYWLQQSQTFTLTTSGSTGAPKEITLTRKQLQQSAARTITALQLVTQDTALVCLDAKYIAGKMMLVRALEANMKIIVTEPSADPLLNIDEQVGFTALVPLQLQEILRHPESVQKLNRMKAVIVGGAAVSTTLQREIQVLTCPVFATYGMTETVSHIALQRLNGESSEDFFAVLPGIKIETDSRGCLAISLPEFPEKIVTNDIVEMMSPNQFRWLGRYDNVINSGGVKISPEKIEKALEAKLNGQAFFVTGIPDEKLGEKLILIVEGKSGDINFSNLNLHPYEIPKAVYHLPTFIRTETGKVNRTRTRLLMIGNP